MGTCSECSIKISTLNNRKTCGTICAVERELRLQKKRRLAKLDKDQYYYSYSHRTRRYTCYNYKRKVIEIFIYHNDMVAKYRKYQIKRINFGPKKRSK